MDEAAFIDRLRAIATHPAARGLNDDAAVLEIGSTALVLTHDMLVEGVHFLPDDAPADIAWKLVAVNMSDLAAKGATPLAVLVGAGLARDAAWNRAFVAGLGTALDQFGAALVGGDTVAMPAAAPVTLGLTAIGLAPPSGAPSRSGAQTGDDLWVSGTIGDAGLGLAARQGHIAGAPEALIRAYIRPQPELDLGLRLAPLVTAMADVSDGLLIDARRIAVASELAISIDVDAIPLSAAWHAVRGDNVDDRIDAATMGDDYQLLFTAAPTRADSIAAAAALCGATITHIGKCGAGQGITAHSAGQPVALPARLGFIHKAPGGDAPAEPGP